VLTGEVHVGKHVVAGGVHHGRKLELLVAQGVGNDSPLGLGFGLGVLKKIVFSIAATAARCLAEACARALRIQ